MPDIALRFNKDMLVLSTPIDYQLNAQGFTEATDREYVALCEPELIEEAYKLEKVIETPCFVTATEGITRARLAYARFENQADEMAQIAYETAAQFSPQHTIAVIGPSGLPLDYTSASSLKQSKQQYHDAVQALMVHPFDAVLFSAFSNAYDAQCALMGARTIYDGPLMISLAPDAEGILADGSTFAEAVALCDEYGADVIGFASPAPSASLVSFARTAANITQKPLYADIQIVRKDSRQFEATEENPYPTPDHVVNVAWALRECGVQFLRVSGAATPSYTGALVATVMGHDVVVDPQNQ